MSESVKEQLSAVNRIYKEQNDLYHTLASKAGLSDAAFWVLYALCAADDVYTQHELSEAWFFPKQTVNSAIANLMRSGRIRLEMIPSTRNKKAIVLTEEGRCFCERHMLPVLRAEATAFAHMNAEDRRRYIALAEQQLFFLKEAFETIE